MDSGETAQAAPKGKRKTLRQKDRIPDDTLESDEAPTKPNLSGPKTERMNIICSCAFFDIRTADVSGGLQKSARYERGGGMVSEAETGHMDVFVMKGIWICP